MPTARVRNVSGTPTLQYSQNEISTPCRRAFSTTIRLATEPKHGQIASQRARHGQRQPGRLATGGRHRMDDRLHEQHRWDVAHEIREGGRDQAQQTDWVTRQSVPMVNAPLADDVQLKSVNHNEEACEHHQQAPVDLPVNFFGLDPAKEQHGGRSQGNQFERQPSEEKDHGDKSHRDRFCASSQKWGGRNVRRELFSLFPPSADDRSASRPQLSRLR